MTRLVRTQVPMINNQFIDAAYDDLILNNRLQTWNERLTHYNELETSARILLNFMAKGGGGISRNVMLNVLTQKTGDAERADLILTSLLKIAQK